MDFGDLISLDFDQPEAPIFDDPTDIGNFSNVFDTPSIPSTTSNRLLEGSSYFAGTPAVQTTPRPDVQPNAGDQNSSILGRLFTSLGMSPETSKMVGSIAPLAIGAGTSALTSFLGGQAGSAAAKGINRDTQRIVAPTPQEQAITNLGISNLSQMTPQSRTPQAVLGDLQTTLTPMLAEILNREGQQRRQMTERLVGSGMSMGGVLPQQENYLRGDTNRAILDMVSKMVAGERQLRTNEATQLQNIVGNQILGQGEARQRNLLTGQGQAINASQAAGAGPANAATLAALIAAILGGQQGGGARA